MEESIVEIKQEMRPIPGYEGLYSITENGKVWSYYTFKWVKPKLIRGYHRIRLWKDTIHRNYAVHRLVALTYDLPKPTDKTQINHKDGNKTNNHIFNLEWVTCQENHNHAIENGIVDRKGERNGKSKLTEKQVKEIRKNYKNRERGEKTWVKYNITHGQYSHIINNKNWYDPNYKKELK